MLLSMKCGSGMKAFVDKRKITSFLQEATGGCALTKYGNKARQRRNCNPGNNGSIKGTYQNPQGRYAELTIQNTEDDGCLKKVLDKVL